MAENTGLIQEFQVFRLDGRDKKGGDRQGAAYFVLDLTNDPFAKLALRAYRCAVRDAGLEDLYYDLLDLEQEIDGDRTDGLQHQKLRDHAKR